MFKQVYNRCKFYLNSYVTFGTIFVILFLLILPTFDFKLSNGFFFNIRYASQNMLVVEGMLLLYVFNIWSYLKKNKNNFYQAHRYENIRVLIKNNICDVIFIGWILETVFWILNITVATIFSDGYYLGVYQFYKITNVIYLVYLVILRYLIISLMSIIIYFIFHTGNKILKTSLFLVVAFNILVFPNSFPISFATLVFGYKFKYFAIEIIYAIFLIVFYIVGLILIKKKFIDKKRDL